MFMNFPKIKDWCLMIPMNINREQMTAWRPVVLVFVGVLALLGYGEHLMGRRYLEQ